jgi:hypothetical protein
MMAQMKMSPLLVAGTLLALAGCSYKVPVVVISPNGQITSRKQHRRNERWLIRCHRWEADV